MAFQRLGLEFKREHNVIYLIKKGVDLKQSEHVETETI